MVTSKTRLLSAFAAVLMLVSLFTCFVLPVTAAGETPYTSIQSFAANDTVTEYEVASLEDLEFLSTVKDSLTADETIYITADIDLSNYTGTKANDLTGLYAKLNGDLDGDGVGVTISGLTLSGAAWLGDYKGTEIANLNFENCSKTSIKATAERSGLLIDVYESNGLTVENVTFKNCSNKVADGDTARASLVIGQVKKGNVTFKNIDIQGSTLKTGPANNAFLVGEVDVTAATTITVDKVYLNGNKFENTTANSSALISNLTTAAVGKTTLSFKNVGIFNTTLNGKNRNGALCGVKGVTVAAVENVMVAGFSSGSFTGMFHSGTTATATNCYSAIPVVTGGAANGTEAAVASGEAAWTLNAAGVSKKWAMDGTAPVFSDDKYTVKVVVGENVSYVNIGGTLTLEEGYEYSVDAAYATVAGNVLTVKAAPADLVISVTATEAEVVYYSISAFDELVAAGTADGGEAWSVSSIEDLEKLSEVKGQTDILNGSSTVYITEDIDLSEYTGTKATDLTGLYAKLNGDLDGDGVGVTISGLTLSGAAWLGDYKGTEIKNLNFENCSKTSIKATAERSGLLIDVYESNGLTVENVTFKNCSNKVADGDTARASLVIGQVKKGNVTFKNIDIQGSTLKTGAANNAFLVGEVDVTAATTITVDKVYLNGNKFEYTTGNTSALISNLTTAAVGKTTLSFKNVGIFNTTFNGKNRNGALCGVKGVTVAAVENVMVAGFSSGSFTGMFFSGTTATATNCYSAIPVVTGGTANGTEAAVASGEAAWTLNAAGVEQKWAMDGTTPIFDTDATLETAKVTLVADVANEEPFTFEVYTDKDGKLFIDEDTRNFATWEKDLSAIFAKDETVKGTHEHAWGTGVVAPEPSCTEKGTKTFTCSVCGRIKTEDIEKLDHQWESGVILPGDEPTKEAGGTKTYTCGICGDTYTEDLPALAYVDLKPVGTAKLGESFRVKVDLVNNPGVASMTLKITYDADAMTLTGIENGDLGELLDASVPETPSAETEISFTSADNADLTGEGTVIVLEFLVKDDESLAEQREEIKIEVTEARNSESDAVSFADAAYSVLLRSGSIRGDINQDEDVDIFDAVLLLRYIEERQGPDGTTISGADVYVTDEMADLNGNDEVDINDAVYLLQFLSGWYTAEDFQTGSSAT